MASEEGEDLEPNTMRHRLFEGALEMQKEPEDPNGEGMAEHLKGEDPQPKTMRHWLFEGALRMQKEPKDPKGKGMAEQKEPKGEQHQQNTNTKK